MDSFWSKNTEIRSMWWPWCRLEWRHRWWEWARTQRPSPLRTVPNRWLGTWLEGICIRMEAWGIKCLATSLQTWQKSRGPKGLNLSGKSTSDSIKMIIFKLYLVVSRVIFSNFIHFLNILITLSIFDPGKVANTSKTKIIRWASRFTPDASVVVIVREQLQNIQKDLDDIDVEQERC